MNEQVFGSIGLPRSAFISVFFLSGLQCSGYVVSVE